MRVGNAEHALQPLISAYLRYLFQQYCRYSPLEQNSGGESYQSSWMDRAKFVKQISLPRMKMQLVHATWLSCISPAEICCYDTCTHSDAAVLTSLRSSLSCASFSLSSSSERVETARGERLLFEPTPAGPTTRQLRGANPSAACHAKRQARTHVTARMLL